MRSRVVIAIAVLAIALPCCTWQQGEERILARIGDDTITAEEFQLSYEFGHGHLRRGENPRRAYLRFMILEKVLAREAQKLHLDTVQAIIHAARTLREELLVERVFEEHALADVEVTEEEIRREINRAAVSIQFRFLPAASESAARELYDTMREKGYAQALENKRDAIVDLNVVEGELTSPLLNVEDVEPAILTILQDLEINTPSEPVEYDGFWYVFEVMDIQQRRVSGSDYARLAPRYRTIIYNRKAMQLGTAFVAETMDPLNVATKRVGLYVLAEALWAWYRAEPPLRNPLHYIEEQLLNTPYTRLLVSEYDTDLVHFGDERWSIRDFLEHFTPGRYSLRASEPAIFRARLADVVALVVRDAVFLRMAAAERLHDQPEFQRLLAQWQDKWLFQEYTKLLLDSGTHAEGGTGVRYDRVDALPMNNLDPTDRGSLTGRSRITDEIVREWLANYADSVAARYDITIDEAALDSLPKAPPGASPYVTVHLLKSNSNKMPFPIVDPGWRPVSDN